MLIIMEPKEYDALVEALEQRPRDMPTLCKLLEMEPPFEEQK